MNVVGARPNFMKIAPVMREMSHHAAEFEVKLVHTGQHYDERMSQLFFEELQIPKPDIYLGVGSKNHGEQTGQIMIEFERELLAYKPDLVVVVGDVNSTVACGLVAVKQGVQLAHIEAGLRSFDRTMPEEINRLLTDQISDYLFVTEASGISNLKKEGIAPDRIHFVGNVMIDTLNMHLKKTENSKIIASLNLTEQNYVILTLHRPHNVDNPDRFSGILNALEQVQQQIPIVFPIHPRSRERLQRFGFTARINKMSGLIITEPLGYLDFLRLMSKAKFALTDSGGIQEETTVLGVPCLTLRENTERPVTVTHGSNKIIGMDPEKIVTESQAILNGEIKKSGLPELWDGKAAERIVGVLRQGEKRV